MMDSTLYDSFDCKITCEEYYGDEPDPDEPDWDADNDIEPDPDLDEVQDNDWWGEEDPDWDPPLQDQHGLTADGYALLAIMDSRGEFL